MIIYVGFKFSLNFSNRLLKSIAKFYYVLILLEVVPLIALIITKFKSLLIFPNYKASLFSLFKLDIIFSIANYILEVSFVFKISKLLRSFGFSIVIKDYYCL